MTNPPRTGEQPRLYCAGFVPWSEIAGYGFPIAAAPESEFGHVTGFSVEFPELHVVLPRSGGQR